MDCSRCGSDPCECQRQLAAPSDWINQTCSMAGCTVVIRSRVGKQMTMPVCKWCQSQNDWYKKSTDGQQRSREHETIEDLSKRLSQRLRMV
jgi:hypothetical protein